MSPLVTSVPGSAQGPVRHDVARARRPWWTRAAVVLSVGLTGGLAVGLSGCGTQEQAPAETAQVAAPPDEASAQAVVAAQRDGVQLPAWAFSSQCDQPRPQAREDGLVVPDPVAGTGSTSFYVPGVEQTLCAIGGVESASVAGEYTDPGGARQGTVEIGVVLTADSTEENLRAVRQAARTAVTEQNLSAQGITARSITIVLTDGSRLSGPTTAQALDSAGDVTGEAIRALTQLRAADRGTHWSVEAGETLVLGTYLEEDVTADTFLSDLEKAASASTGVQLDAGNTGGVAREDRVTVTDGKLELVYREAGRLDLPRAALTQLRDLSNTDDVGKVVATLGPDAQGRDVLRIRTHAQTPGLAPDVESLVSRLTRSTAQVGLELDHEIEGASDPQSS